MRYVKHIEIHFTTKRKPIKVVGASAQELFDQKAYHNDNEKVNQLVHDIEILSREITEEILIAHDIPLSWDRSNFVNPVEEWRLEKGKLRIGDVPFDIDPMEPPLTTSDPNIIKTAEKLFEKLDALEKAIGDHDGI